MLGGGFFDELVEGLIFEVSKDGLSVEHPAGTYGASVGDDFV